MTDRVTSGRFKYWRMALAALVLAACSQAGLAAHQFEHDAGTAAEVCGICVGLQNQAAPPDACAAFDPQIIPAACPSPRAEPAKWFDGVARHAARGPPRIL